MARSLLGGNTAAVGGIDVIPHTGLVVYGREYFFGSGIQSEDPVQFRQSTGMQPLHLVTLGRTAVSRAAFEAWCVAQAHAGTYSATSYDLLQRNCNNFSFDAATQCLDVPAHSYPAWILEVPRRFLSSPLGQMLRPMLENMRITHPAGAESVLGTTTVTNSSGGAAAAPELSAVQVDEQEQPNPWANIPAKKETLKPAADDPPLLFENGNQHHANSNARAAAVSPREMPLLDSFTQPLLSNDTKIVGICIQKVIAACSNEDDDDNVKTKINYYKETLEQAAPLLKQPPPPPPTVSSSSTNHEHLPREQAEKVAAILWHVLQRNAALSRTFALLLLRIVVLHCPQQQQQPLLQRQQQTAAAPASLMACLEWVQSALTNGSSSGSSSNASDDDDDKHKLPSAAARSTAWLVASNAVAAGSLVVSLDPGDNNDSAAAAAAAAAAASTHLVDAAVQDAAHERPEVRQAATAFLYNAVLLLQPRPSISDEEEETIVSDAVVGILCAMLERVAAASSTDEKAADATTTLRALMVLGRILKPTTTANGVFEAAAAAAAAKRLVVDLGLPDALLPLALKEATTTTTNKKGGDDGQIQTLASELLQILQQ